MAPCVAAQSNTTSIWCMTTKRSLFPLRCGYGTSAGEIAIRKPLSTA